MKAEHREAASFGTLGEGVQKRTAFSLLCQPSRTEICARMLVYEAEKRVGYC